MIKELRKLHKTNVSREKYIRNLQYTGQLKKIVNEQGYVCYDTEELKNFKHTKRVGRPAKVVD